MSIAASPGRAARPDWAGGIAQGVALAILLGLSVLFLLITAQRTPEGRGEALPDGPPAPGADPAPVAGAGAPAPGLVIVLVDAGAAGPAAVRPGDYEVVFEAGGPLEVNVVAIAGEAERRQFLAHLADAEQLCAASTDITLCRPMWVIDTTR